MVICQLFKELTPFAVVVQQIFIGMKSKLFPPILKKGREREGSPKLQELSACRWILEDRTSQETASRLAWLERGVQVRGKARMMAGAQVTEDKDCSCNKECEHRNKRLCKIFLKKHEEGWFAKKFWWVGTIFTFCIPLQLALLKFHVGTLLLAYYTDGGMSSPMKLIATDTGGMWWGYDLWNYTVFPLLSPWGKSSLWPQFPEQLCFSSTTCPFYLLDNVESLPLPIGY